MVAPGPVGARGEVDPGVAQQPQIVGLDALGAQQPLAGHMLLNITAVVVHDADIVARAPAPRPRR